MNMIRIAVCFSGQSRTYKQCLLNQKRLIESIDIQGQLLQIDYFLHTWDTNQWTSVSSDKMKLNSIPHVKANVDIEYIKSTVNLVDYKIEKFNENTHNGFWPGLLYSMYYCNYLKRKKEIMDSFRYDLVIKMRFDVLFNPMLKYTIPLPLEDHIMYTASLMSRMPNELNFYNFDDVFFYGTSFTMDIISDTYRFVNKKLGHKIFENEIENKDLSFEFYYGPGCLIYRHGTLYGMSPGKINPLYYIIARYGVMARNLDGIRDFEEIAKLNQNYYNNINNSTRLI